jgi:hypothetical protein
MHNPVVTLLKTRLTGVVVFRPEPEVEVLETSFPSTTDSTYLSFADMKNPPAIYY